MFCDVIWCYMLLHDMVWYDVITYGKASWYMMLYDVIWYSMVFHGYIRYCYQMNSNSIWCFRILYGLVRYRRVIYMIVYIVLHRFITCVYIYIHVLYTYTYTLYVYMLRHFYICYTVFCYNHRFNVILLCHIFHSTIYSLFYTLTHYIMLYYRI